MELTSLLFFVSLLCQAVETILGLFEIILDCMEYYVTIALLHSYSLILFVQHCLQIIHKDAD